MCALFRKSIQSLIDYFRRNLKGFENSLPDNQFTNHASGGEHGSASFSKKFSIKNFIIQNSQRYFHSISANTTPFPKALRVFHHSPVSGIETSIQYFLRILKRGLLP